ncbi:UNVERIFIED_CONTAM: hypothetical protein RMT77_000824 [Armadillidium vulgare]
MDNVGSNLSSAFTDSSSFSNFSSTALPNASTVAPYCSTFDWTNFHKSYQAVHGCSSLIVCIFGSIANIINIVVLTRRSMISPTNAILTALAITDLLVMAEYIPYTLHHYILTGRSDKSRYSWGWAVFVLFHAHFGQVFHTISISLTVALAVWRYIAIGYPQHNYLWCSMSRSKIAILACIAFSLFFNIPNYINLNIKTVENENVTLHLVHFTYQEALNTVNFITYSVVLKLFPCAALTWLSFALIRELLRAATRRAALTKKKAESEKQADRVTKMLLAILILFLISEVPQGILGLLYILPNSGFTSCYEKLGEIMDMLVLFNSAVNFLLYCSMSQQFRDTFKELIEPCTIAVSKNMLSYRWRTVPPSDTGTDCSTTCVTHV